MQISVIIPTYNRAEVLVRALDSVLAQSRPADEIIVVDDGSTDHTEKVMQDYPEARYLQQDNLGVSAARNLGIAVANGDWLAFLDSDDEWLPHKLEKQCELVAANPDFKLVHTEEIWIRNGKRVNQMDKHEKAGGDIFQRCLPLCAISPSSVMIHRSLFDELGKFDETLPACEDYDLWLRICAQEQVLYESEPCIVKYGGHEDQLSRKYWGMDRFRIQALEKILEQDVLSAEQKRAAIEMLLEKIRVYVLGAQKRDKEQEVAQYESKAAHYRRQLEATC